MKPILFWRSAPLHRRHTLPASPGLYAVVSLGRVLYIGKSNDICRRWTSTGDWRHHRYWLATLQPWCRIRYFETRAYDRLEYSLINEYSPPWNDTDKPWWSTQDNALLGKVGALGWMMWAKRKSRRKKSLGWLSTTLWWTVMLALGLVVIEVLL